jgi:hypothetical protein
MNLSPSKILMAVLLISGLISAGVQASNDGDYYSPQIGDHGDEGNPGGAQRLEPVGSHYWDFYSSPDFYDKVILGNASYGWGDAVNGILVVYHTDLSSQGYQQYIHNVNYTFPSVWDIYAAYSPGYPGDIAFYDTWFAMTPTATASLGRSGSEVEFVTLAFNALNAMDPDAKAMMKQNGLIMPTLQMLWRRTRPRVPDDATYLTGLAHPSAFPPLADWSWASPGSPESVRYLQMAAEIRTNNIPPMIQLRVEDDTFNGVSGVDYFDPAYRGERLYTTPVSIARLYRGREHTKTMTVTAEDSYDINNRPLTYKWVVLRGDPDLVRIIPLNESQSRVRIEFDYHTTRPYAAPEGTMPNSNLAIVGAFVHNGVYYSAPGYITSYTMPDEIRTYDDSGRVQKITYTRNIAIYGIDAIKGWTADTYHYNSDGDLVGWTRDGITDFTREGYVVGTKDAGGNPVTVDNVNYTLSGSWLSWTAAGTPFAYTNNKAFAFRCDPMSIPQGGSATLAWGVSNATGLSIDQGIGPVASSGTTNVSPSATTTYTLTAVVAGETKTASVTVKILPPPVAVITANPMVVAQGQGPVLSWTTANGTSVSIDPGIGEVGASGQRCVYPAAPTTTYTLSVTGSGGTTTSCVTVTVAAIQPLAFVGMEADAGASNFFMKWNSAPNVRYRIMQSTNLMSGFIPLFTNIPAMFPVNTYSIGLSSDPAKFYRVDEER